MEKEDVGTKNSVAPNEPIGSGDGVPPAPDEESGEVVGVPEAQASPGDRGMSDSGGRLGDGEHEQTPTPDPQPLTPGEAERTYTQAEVDARLASLRRGLEAKHAKELRGLQLQMQAATLAPALGIADVDAVMAFVDPRAVQLGDDGRAGNLAE